MLPKFLAGAAALAMMASPALAAAPSAQSTAKLSVANAKVATPAGARSATAGARNSQAAGGLLLPLIAVAAVVVGIVLIADGDDDPDSP